MFLKLLSLAQAQVSEANQDNYFKNAVYCDQHMRKTGCNNWSLATKIQGNTVNKSECSNYFWSSKKARSLSGVHNSSPMACQKTFFYVQGQKLFGHTRVLFRERNKLNKKLLASWAKLKASAVHI